jgi:hypothetical protein
MAQQTFSREYLQGLPNKNKKNAINQIIQNHIGAIQQAANTGKTSYTLCLTNPTTTQILGNYHNTLFPSNHPRQHIGQFAPHAPSNLGDLNSLISSNEFIDEFKIKFPGCDISYEETWIDVNQTTRVLNKNIVIDWS